MVDNGDAGFSVLDVSDPTAPAPVSGLDSVGIALWLARHGDHVFLANNEFGIVFVIPGVERMQRVSLRIFVLDVESALRVRTGEMNAEAL